MIEQAFYRDTRPGKDRFATENFRILRHHAAHDRNYALETQSIQANITDHLFPIQRFNDSTIHAATARHKSERVFYPDTNDVSSASKVVALSVARNRTREWILSASTTRSRRLSELISALRLDPIYVVRIPAAPFAVADALTIHPIKPRW